jgi:glycerophosphoryl diester phosphodiesterase
MSDGWSPFDRSPFLRIAHRAGNTVAGLRAAEAANCDVAEADIWYYRGRLEVRHTKTMGPAPLLWDRWSLEPAWQPRLQLDQLVAAAGHETLLMLDLKGGHQSLSEAVIAEMRSTAPGVRYLVCSQWWDSLERFRHVEEAFVIHSAGNARMVRDVVERLSWGRRHAVTAHRRLLSTGIVARLHEHAEAVISWPINTMAEYEEVRAYGVDGITSDSIPLLQQLANRRT